MTITHYTRKVLFLGMALSASLMVATSAQSLELVAPTPGSGMFVVDSNGTNVGPVIGTGTGVGQLPKVGFETTTGEAFVLIASNTGLEGDLLLLFQSRTCEGNPFVVDITSESPFMPTAIAPPGRTLYIPVTGAVAQELTIGSGMDPTGECNVLVSNEEDPDPTLPVLQAEGAMDLNTLFVGPFDVRVLQ